MIRRDENGHPYLLLRGGKTTPMCIYCERVTVGAAGKPCTRCYTVKGLRDAEMGGFTSGSF